MADNGPRFEVDIRPLFRARDRQSMTFAFDLYAFPDVSDHADRILERLKAGEMPCDREWPARQVELFADSPRAGPSFAFYRSIDYLPHRDAAWTVFAERLTEITSRCDQLGLDGVHTTLESLLSRFTDAQGRRVRSHPPSAIPGAP